MNATVADVMATPVMTITKHETAEHARKLMRDHKVTALPVVGPDGEPLGIVTSSDLLADHAEATPVSTFMSADPLTVPPGEGTHVVARIMRNHHTHHVIVVDGGKVAGIVSAYDLLELVEDHRFVMKNAPTPSSKKKPNRQ